MLTKKISLCMIAYNESDLIGDCIESAVGTVDEIVVGIDSRTTDNTAEVVRRVAPSADIFTFDWNMDFSAARNAAIERASGWWILVLDADERLTADGHAAINRAITSAPAMDAFQLAMEHCDIGRTTIYGQDYHTRLFKSRLRYKYPIHEQVEGDTLCQVQATTAHIVHVGYDPLIFKDRHKLVRNLDVLEKWINCDPYCAIPNYYMAKVMFSRGNVSSASTFASIALRFANKESGDISDAQKQYLIDMLRDYAPQ